jgi:hypothetical protein
LRFNAPPNWPTPPEGWTPPPGWQPDPSWPKPPKKWQLWLDDTQDDAGTAERLTQRRRTNARILTLTAVVLALIAAAAAPATVGGLVALVGVVALLVGVWATMRGRLSWARIHSRKMGAAVLGGGILMALIGGAPQPATPTANAPSSAPSATGSAPSSATAPTSAASTSAASTSAASTSAARVVTTTQRPRATSQPPNATPAPRAAPAAKPETALAALQTMQVKGRAPKTGYHRYRFGQAWADVDRNGCDTRNDVLRRDLDDYVLKAGTNGCLVLRGTLHDRYTGRTVRFVRGQSSSMDVQVDHVVALSDAWQKGAQGWDAAERERFANDPLNLLAVDGPTNASKSDGDAATWLPPVKSYRCSYVARQVAVKVKYGLWMTGDEQTATARLLSSCPTKLLPKASTIALGGGKVEVVAKRKPKAEAKAVSQPKPKGTGSGSDPNMGTCKAAKAAAYGPYFEGKDAEYGWYQDRDHDGVVCE